METDDAMPEILSVTETTKRLSISRQTLYRRIKDGSITPLPGNPALRREALQFRREDVLRLADPTQPKATSTGASLTADTPGTYRDK